MLQILIIIINVVLLLVFIAFFTTFERKVMGSIQRRIGPDLVGKFGLLQPFADGLKLLLKETLITKDSSTLFFLIAPVLTFATSLMTWFLLPFTEHGGISNPENSLILYLSISSLGVYGIILAGWASNSKYSFLGCIRSTAQIVSYEVMFSFTIFPLFLLANSCSANSLPNNFSNSLFDFSSLNLFLLYPTGIMFLIAALAETNRTPFDLPEAEAELVAGYNIEYSSLAFALFFLGEYSNMGAVSLLFSILYLNSYIPFCDVIDPVFSLFEYIFLLFPSWIKSILFFIAYPIRAIFNLFREGLQNPAFILLGQSLTVAFKTVFVCFFIIWVRATLPRYRFDQLISLCWTKLLPLSLTYFLLVSSILFSIGSLIVFF